MGVKSKEEIERLFKAAYETRALVDKFKASGVSDIDIAIVLAIELNRAVSSAMPTSETQMLFKLALIGE
jgi:hypothetical protein